MSGAASRTNASIWPARRGAGWVSRGGPRGRRTRYSTAWAAACLVRGEAAAGVDQIVPEQPLNGERGHAADAVAQPAAGELRRAQQHARHSEALHARLRRQQMEQPRLVDDCRELGHGLEADAAVETG